MPIRHRVLLGIVLVAFAAFVGSAALDPNWSKGDVVFLVVFALFFLALVFLMLIRRGNEAVEGHHGLPRGFWVVFASFAAAFALLMLVGVFSLPFVGFEGFEAVLGPERWWLHVVVAAAVYSFMRRRLH